MVHHQIVSAAAAAAIQKNTSTENGNGRVCFVRSNALPPGMYACMYVLIAYVTSILVLHEGDDGTVSVSRNCCFFLL